MHADSPGLIFICMMVSSIGTRTLEALVQAFINPAIQAPPLEWSQHIPV